jgi:hypothetical protein
MKIRKQKKFVKATVISLCIGMSITASSAGSLTRDLLGIGVVVGGVALYQAAKKGCHPVKDQDTGSVSWFCDKGPFADTSGATLKTANTYQLRKALNADRISSGMPPDPDDCDAHHIVSKGENRTWANDMVTSARSSLRGCVEIDSAENGIYLPATKSGAQCQGSYHKSLHTKAYYTDIEDRLRNAKQFGGCDAVKSELNSLKQELISGAKW